MQLGFGRPREYIIHFDDGGDHHAVDVLCCDGLWFMCSLVLAVVMVTMQLNLVAPLKDSFMIIKNINVYPW